MKRIICLMAVISILFAGVVFAGSPSGWAAEEVKNAINAGYVPEEIQSDYTAPIKRGEFAHMAAEFLKYELGFSDDEFNEKINTLFDAVEFSDTTDENIVLAARCGIVYGYGGNIFAPDKFITRQEAASMLARVYNLYGSIYLYSDIDYDDNDMIADWAFSDIKFCAAKGIMKGVSEKLFNPEGVYTKEQAIATFARLDSDTDWENHNKTAKLRRKMSKELAEKELFADGTVKLIDKYETPYGTVYNTSIGGMMRSPGDELFLIDENGETFRLSDILPISKGYWFTPKIKDINYDPEKKELTFEVELTSGNGEAHKSGTYSFETNLETKETKLIDFVPEEAEK